MTHTLDCLYLVHEGSININISVGIIQIAPASSFTVKFTFRHRNFQKTRRSSMKAKLSGSEKKDRVWNYGIYEESLAISTSRST